jgi:hypothetical protein
MASVTRDDGANVYTPGAAIAPVTYTTTDGAAVVVVPAAVPAGEAVGAVECVAKGS